MSYRKVYDGYFLVDEQYYDATEGGYISIYQEDYDRMIEEMYNDRYLEDLEDLKDIEF